MRLDLIFDLASLFKLLTAKLTSFKMTSSEELEMDARLLIWLVNEYFFAYLQCNEF